jgi:cytochrome c
MSSDLGFNKIAGALLATGLAVLGLSELSSIVFKQEPAKKPGYAVAVVEDTAAAGGADAPEVPPDWGTVLPAANVQAGAEVAKKCQSCHDLSKGGPNLTGPNLWDVLGRKPGSHPGFAYSSAMTDFGGKLAAWDYAHIDQFIKGPQAYLAGTKMSFVGLKKQEDRINVIAYLRTMNDSPPPIPAPNPQAAAPAAADAATTAPTGAPTPDAATAAPQTPPAQAGAAPTGVSQ